MSAVCSLRCCGSLKCVAHEIAQQTLRSLSDVKSQRNRQLFFIVLWGSEIGRFCKLLSACLCLLFFLIITVLAADYTTVTSVQLLLPSSDAQHSGCIYSATLTFYSFCVNLVRSHSHSFSIVSEYYCFLSRCRPKQCNARIYKNKNSSRKTRSDASSDS